MGLRKSSGAMDAIVKGHKKPEIEKFLKEQQL